MVKKEIMFIKGARNIRLPLNSTKEDIKNYNLGVYYFSLKKRFFENLAKIDLREENTISLNKISENYSKEMKQSIKELNKDYTKIIQMKEKYPKMLNHFEGEFLTLWNILNNKNSKLEEILKFQN